jgi:hypothetical protein
VASQALSGVLSSIGPSTVVRYLDFACGKGIGPADSDEPEAAVGLESLAQPVPDSASQSSTSIRSPTPTLSNSSGDGTDADTFEKLDFHSEDRVERIFDYGNVSNKVGEAAACWLARWCADLLAAETQAAGMPTGQLAVRPRRHTDAVGDRPAARPVKAHKIWADGGLPTKWVCAVLASDSLFVRGEKERYALAKRIFDLRRSQGVFSAEDDHEWTQFFRHGIYYANLVRTF